MSGSKKYSVLVFRNAGGTWVARFLRRKTSRCTIVEREQTGFDSQDAALAWAAAQRKLYLAQLTERNLRRNAARSGRRKLQAERAAIVGGYSYRELAERAEQESDCRARLTDSAELLWQEVAFRMLKGGISEDAAVAEADTRVGRNYQARLDKAKLGLLDPVAVAVREMAVANARRWAQIGAEILKSGK